jgi:hypothetical protein
MSQANTPCTDPVLRNSLPIRTAMPLNPFSSTELCPQIRLSRNYAGDAAHYFFLQEIIDSISLAV